MDITHTPDYTIILLQGEIDIAAATDLRDAIGNAIGETARTYYLDFTRVTFLDSHGVGLLVHVLKKVHAHDGNLVFTGLGGQPASVLKMVGFNDKIVSFAPSLSVALPSRVNEGNVVPLPYGST